MKYFLHDTSAFDDEKISELFLEFGYEGLGLFYTALEKMGKQEKPIKTTVLKAQLKVGKRLEKCWLFMEQIQLISSSNGETFNKQLLNFSETYQIKKEKTRKKVSEWRNRQADSNDVTGYVPVSNPPKVKESKVKESKVKNKEKDDFLTKIISAFQEVYFDVFQIEYVITSQGKENSFAGQILNLFKEKNPTKNSEETIIELRKYFQMCCEIPDEWMQKKMSLPFIISNFNTINNTLRNGKSKNRSVASRSAEIDAAIGAVYAAKGL